MNDKNNTPTEKLYTLKQLAEILQVTKSHLYIMCRRGDIPYIDVGTGKNREYRFDLEQVKKFLQKRKDINDLLQKKSTQKTV